MPELSAPLNRIRWQSDAIPLVLASLPAFLIGMVYGVGGIFRDCSLTCNVGYKLAPAAILVMRIISVPISSLTVRWANRMINRFGLIFALLSMPVALSLGSVYLIVQTTILAMLILRIVYSAPEKSVYGQGVDRMILAIHEKDVPGVKTVLHGLAIRVVRGLGEQLVLGLELGLSLSCIHMTVAYIIVLIFWIATAIAIPPPHLIRPSSQDASQYTLKSIDT